MTGMSRIGIFALQNIFLEFKERNGRDPCGKNDNESAGNQGSVCETISGEAVTEAKIGSVMNAYSSYDGMPAGGSQGLLTDLCVGK